MVSPELIRRYPFFAGLSHEHIATLAQTADEVEVAPDHVFFREDAEIDKFYLVLEGAIAMFMEVPDRTREQPVSSQLTGELNTEQIVVTTVGPGEVFASSALIPPSLASSGAKAVTRSRVVGFDARQLLERFEEDCRFGYLMTQKAGAAMRERLRDMRIESLSGHRAS